MLRKIGLVIFGAIFLPASGLASVIDITYTGTMQDNGESVSGWFRVDLSELSGTPREDYGENNGWYYAGAREDHSLVSSSMTHDYLRRRPGDTETEISRSYDAVGVADISNMNDDRANINNDFLALNDSFRDYSTESNPGDPFGGYRHRTHSLFLMVLDDDFIEQTFLENIDVYLDASSNDLEFSHGYLEQGGGNTDQSGRDIRRWSTRNPFDVNTVRIISTVSEPSSLAALLIGGLGLFVRRKFIHK